VGLWSPRGPGLRLGPTARARPTAQAQTRPGASPTTVGGALGWRAVGVSCTLARVGAMVEKEEAGGGISEEEAAQYDRQIRLWGLDAQKRSGPAQLEARTIWRGRLVDPRRSGPRGSGKV
jgi:hypothetical protein